MPTFNMLYKSEIEINEDISIVIPTVGYVVDHEDDYYGLVSALTAMPVDMMVELDKVGIDFTKINEYELFLLLFGGIVKSSDTSMIFGELDVSDFQTVTDEKTGSIFLHNSKTGISIDRKVQRKIAYVLRKIHHLEKNEKKPGNEEAKNYMLERAKKKASRTKATQDSSLEALIISLVNTAEFKYDYETVRDMSIYQFNESVRQVANKVGYDNLMIGVYAGTVNAKELSQDALTWFANTKQ